MGTTLQNGVYLPNEGERNCYAGLKTNWEILDQKVADVTALQQAVAGALHREIVESLPTTDIDPNTIYMILSGTSATENVYNEYMYVNNAWELIGTSATDLTNYYTKAEVDGKLLLKANASDLTSHTGDTTIHVTTADKNKWNNQTYVFRYSSTALVASSTNSNALLDNTDNLKVGDKVIDSSGVLFSITAMDTQNSTFTIGTALVDLAQDSDVVHKSGNETVGGLKTFTDSLTIYNPDNTVTPKGLTIRNAQWGMGESGGTTVSSINFLDKNSAIPASIIASKGLSGQSFLRFSVRTKDSQNNTYAEEIYYNIDTSGNVSFRPWHDNIISLGTSAYKWKDIYATNYYYGNNNVEFSTKFVTTDTAQTITESKTFANTIKSQKEIEFTGNRSAYILPQFSASYSGLSLCTYGSSGAVRIGTWKVDDNDNTKHVLDSSLGYLNISTGSANSINIVYLTPRNASKAKLGDSVNKWHEINGVEPSSLSLPSGNANDVIDISSYITNMSGNVNNYTAPANGWVSIAVDLCKEMMLSISGFIGCSATRTASGRLMACIPIVKNQQLSITIYSDGNGSTAFARFIPCQGNV